jgi:sialic acid synthase SpsE
MNNTCDLFLVTPSNASELRYLGFLAKKFVYQANLTYNGYLNISANRVKLIPLISLLKKQGVSVYSVPIDYKNSNLISKEAAFQIASECARKENLRTSFDSSIVQNINPLIWSFSSSSLIRETAGGVIMVDRLDGHIWSSDELETYMYDYNNIY